MTRRALAAALLLCAVAAPAAHAGPGLKLTTTPIVDARIAAGERAALGYWGRLPNCPDGIVWDGLTSSMSDFTIGLTTDPCLGYLNTDWLAADVPDSDVCTAEVHEIKHMLDYQDAIAAGDLPQSGHTAGPTPQDPAGVMVDGRVATPGTPPQCLPSALEVYAPASSLRGKRSIHRRADRRWCHRHRHICKNRYPLLAQTLRKK